jgi:hypothetical protein
MTSNTIYAVSCFWSLSGYTRTPCNLVASRCLASFLAYDHLWALSSGMVHPFQIGASGFSLHKTVRLCCLNRCNCVSICFLHNVYIMESCLAEQTYWTWIDLLGSPRARVAGCYTQEPQGSRLIGTYLLFLFNLGSKEMLQVVPHIPRMVAGPDHGLVIAIVLVVFHIPFISDR